MKSDKILIETEAPDDLIFDFDTLRFSERPMTLDTESDCPISGRGCAPDRGPIVQ
jgi:hypothetical protein